MPFKYGRKRRATGKRSYSGRRSGSGPSWANSGSLNTTKRTNRRFQRSGGSALTTGPNLARNVGGLMPPIVWAQHKYVTQYVLTAEATTGLTGSEFALSLNGLFDPEFTAVGHQPRGFDQMAAMMKRYCVYKVDVQVRVVNHNPTAVCMVNVRPSGSNYNLNNKLPYQESENATVAYIEADRPNSFNQTYYIADVEGKSRGATLVDDKYSASTGVNPSLNSYISVACGSANGTGGGVNCTVMLSLVYHTRWSERINLAIS